MKNIFSIVLVIIGTLIGAGFASGREIYIFFLQYGKTGIIGIILSSIITSAIIFKVLKIVKTYEIENYNKLLERINWKYEYINKIINVIVNAFLLISFYVMVAGFSAYVAQSYNIPTYVSSIVFVTICYLTFKKNIKGVIKVNELLVPFLILLIMYLGLKNSLFIIKDVDQINQSKNGWIISSILYTSYNSIVLIPVLTSIRKCIDNKKAIIKTSIISGLIIILLAISIFGLLLRGEVWASSLEMPLAEITLQFGYIFKYIYGCVIIVSIFTSAISTGYSFLTNISTNKKSYNKILLIICVTGVFISNIGFSKLVEILYPIFGILGLVQIIMICKYRE